MKPWIKARKWSGHSQRSIARASGVNYFRIVKAELGALSLTVDEVEKIMKVIESAHNKQARRIKQFRARRAEAPALPPAA